MFYSSGNTGVLKHGLIQEVEPNTAPHTKFSMISLIFPHNCSVRRGIVRFLEQSLFLLSRLVINQPPGTNQGTGRLNHFKYTLNPEFLLLNHHRLGRAPRRVVHLRTDFLVGPQSHVVLLALGKASDGLSDDGVLISRYGLGAGEVALEAVMDLVAVGLCVLGPLDRHLLGGRVGHGADRRSCDLVALDSPIEVTGSSRGLCVNPVGVLSAVGVAVSICIGECTTTGDRLD